VVSAHHRPRLWPNSPRIICPLIAILARLLSFVLFLYRAWATTTQLLKGLATHVRAIREMSTGEPACVTRALNATVCATTFSIPGCNTFSIPGLPRNSSRKNIACRRLVNLTNTPVLSTCLGVHMVDHNATKSIPNTVTVLWCRALLVYDLRNRQFSSQNLEKRKGRSPLSVPDLRFQNSFCGPTFCVWICMYMLEKCMSRYLLQCTWFFRDSLKYAPDIYLEGWGIFEIRRIWTQKDRTS